MDVTFFIIFVVSDVLCGCFIWLSGRRKSLAAALEAQIIRMKQQCRDFEQRMMQLENHAIDYLLSVGGEGTAELAEMKMTLDQVETLCTEAQSLLRVRDFHAVHAASRLLEHDYSEFEKTRAAFDRRAFPNTGWEVRFEELLQSLGERVTEASVQANALNMQKRRTRRLSTITGLAEIGINKVVKEIRKNASGTQSLTATEARETTH